MLHDLFIRSDWVTPTEFWRLTPGQVWWVIEAKMPPEVVSRESDRAEVRKMIKAAKAKEAMQNG